MGAPTNAERGIETTRLLARGFAEYTTVTLVATAGESCPQTVPVSGGKVKEAALVFTVPLEIGVRKARSDSITLRYDLPDHITAPAAAGTVVGKAVAVSDGAQIGEVPVALAADVAKGGFWDRLFHR